MNIFIIRDLFRSYSGTYFSSDQSEFLARGLIFGDDSELSAAMKQLFQDLGLSHFTAASGANLRLFFPEWLQNIHVLKWMPVWSIWELIGVGIYLNLASFSPSLWRAFIFWFLAWLGRCIGKKVPFTLLIAWALTVTFLLHKEYFGLLGFQLSFLCVLALRFSQALMSHEKSLQESISKKHFVWIREMFRDSLCIFFFLTPLLYYRFGEIVPMSIFGTMAASAPLQLFTQLSLVAAVIPNFLIIDWFRQSVYSVIAGIFFILWIVHSSVLLTFVWLGMLIGIGSLIVQVQRGRSVWRMVQ